MKLRKQLFILLSLMTVLPLGVLWFLLGSMVVDDQIKSVRDKHLVLAQNLGAALERYHDDVTTTFEFIAGNAAQGHHFAYSSTMLKKLHFRHICIAEYKTGKVVHEVSPFNALCPTTIPQKRFASLVELAETAPGKFSSVIAGPDGKSQMMLARKIGDKLAVGAVLTDYFVKLGKTIAFGEKGHAAIVDKKGNVLAHPLDSWIEARKNISKVSAVKRMLNGERGVEVFYSPALKGDMIAGLTAIGDTGWGVMVPQPIAELYAHAAKTRISIFSIIAICVVAAAGLAGLVARWLSGSLNTVIRGAEDVEHGKTGVHVDVKEDWRVPEEFKNLQERFNAMAKAIEEHQAEQERERVEAETAHQSRKVFLANLGHELKAPLNSISGFSQVLRDAKPGTISSKDQKEFLSHIQKSASHMLAFINDLVDFNRMELGIHPLNMEIVPVLDVVRFCEATHRREIEAKKAEINVTIPDRNLKIRTDERSINQILINLVSNALKYSYVDCKIDVTVRRCEDGGAEFIVADHGIGIPEDQLGEVFVPFKRCKDPAVANVQGTGLGLSIVHKLTKLLGWDLQMESEYGFGTTVRVIIPAKNVVGSGGASSRQVA